MRLTNFLATIVMTVANMIRNHPCYRGLLNFHTPMLRIQLVTAYTPGLN